MLVSYLLWHICHAFVFVVPHSQAESELQRATMDATRITKQLEETIDEFERQKIRDIKVCCSLCPPRIKISKLVEILSMSG